MHPGVLLALLAYFVFCICDSLIKSIGPGTSVFQIGFFITLFSFVPVLAFTLRHDPLSAMFKMNQPWLVAGRAASGICAGMFAFYSFTHLPFAESYALIFLAPVFVTVLSIFFLGEQVRALRWSAVVIGLIGVWVIVRPGFRELQLGHLTAIFAAMMGATSFVFLRKLGQSERRITLIGVVLFASLIVNGIAMLPQFHAPSPLEWAKYVGAGTFAGLGHVTLLAAARTTPANLIAPANYSQMIWAVLIGYFFFQEIPDAWTFTGIALVLFSGLMTLVRDEMRSGWLTRTHVVKKFP
ncbi:MAG: DMT family transporter [Rhizobiaceae bacterium]